MPSEHTEGRKGMQPRKRARGLKLRLQMVKRGISNAKRPKPSMPKTPWDDKDPK